MHADIAAHRNELIHLCRSFGVARLDLFGSATRADEFDTGRSDADFLVAFEPCADDDPLGRFFAFAAALEAVLGRHVDLVEIGGVENPYLWATLEASRELIFLA